MDNKLTSIEEKQFYQAKNQDELAATIKDMQNTQKEHTKQIITLTSIIENLSNAVKTLDDKIQRVAQENIMLAKEFAGLVADKKMQSGIAKGIALILPFFVAFIVYEFNQIQDKVSSLQDRLTISEKYITQIQSYNLRIRHK